MVLGGKIALLTVGIKKMDVLVDDGCFGEHSGIVRAHQCDFLFFFLPWLL